MLDQGQHDGFKTFYESINLRERRKSPSLEEGRGLGDVKEVMV